MNCFGIQAGNNWIIFRLHVKGLVIVFFSVCVVLCVCLRIECIFVSMEKREQEVDS